MANENEEVSVLGQLLADEAASATETKATPDVEALQRQLEYEKQRNDSLQGRVDSQLRPLNQTVRELQQQLNQQRAAPMRVEVPKAPVVDVTVQDLLAELSPADRELMGEKQLAILAKLVEKPTQAMVNRVRTELQASFDARFEAQEAKLRQVEGQAAGQTGRELWDRVDQLSPGARDRNDVDDPKWVEFLNQKDPISGRMRKDLGNAAVDAGDVSRLALLHDEFLKSTGQTKAVDQASGQNRELRPDASRAEPGVSSSTLPTLKNSEIEQFYKDLASGKYEAKPQLADKMEALITAAIQDGRVV
jgi:hypothetical protein